MKLSSVFYVVFLLLFAATPLCATTKVTESRMCTDNPVVRQEFLNVMLRSFGLSGNLAGAKEVIALGAGVDDEKYDPLYPAIMGGNIEIVRLLLDRDVQKWINESLHGAVLYKNIEIVQLLIDKGADVNFPDFTGSTPLERAVDFGPCAIVKQLIIAGAFISNDIGKLVAMEGGQEVIGQEVIDVFEEINKFFVNPVGTIEILEQLPPQEKWQEIILLLGASISQGREDLVAMLMKVAPEFKSALQKQAYTVAKRVGNHPVKNKMFTLRELAKERVKALN
jgi:hypothetical protein